jgi:ribonuclease HI
LECCSLETKIIKTKTKTHITEGLTTGWFDGAAQSDGLQSGAGGLLRISKNSYYSWTFNCGPGTNTRAELLGVWATLHLASRLNIEDIQIIGDSKIVIDWLNNKGKLQVSSLLGWMDRVRELHTTFRHISYKHTLREHNKEVDALSKTALQKQVGLFTYNHWLDEHEGPTHFLNLY